MSSTQTSARIILIAVGLIGGLFFTWWLTLIAMAALSVRWSAWEVPLIGLMMDLLYLPTLGFFAPVPYFTIFGIVIVWLFEPLRKQFLM